MRQHSVNWPLFYLSKPNGEVLLGWGSIHEIKVEGSGRVDAAKDAISEFENNLKTDKSLPPWLGGFSFFDKNKKEEKEDVWADIPSAIFFLPKYFFHLKDNSLSFQRFDCEDEQESLKSILQKIEDFAFSPLETDEDTVWIEQKNDNEEQNWKKSFSALSKKFSSGELNKVVLSRKKTYSSKKPVPFTSMWQKFSKISSSHTYQFAFLWHNNLFIGSSPEILFSMNEKSVSVPAIAGTRPRGKNEVEDIQLAQNLLQSKKEQEEHRYVVDYIREKLQALGHVIVPKAPIVLKLPFLQHLFTNHILHPKTSVQALDLLNLLHPTPAMAGVPKELALEFLHETESYDRGYYASPIGYFHSSHKDACFVVAIRSALIQTNKFHIFAGAGVVQASDADQEWIEIENKMKTMTQVVAS